MVVSDEERLKFVRSTSLYNSLSTLSSDCWPIVFHSYYDISFCGFEKIHPFDAGKWGKIFNFLKLFYFCTIGAAASGMFSWTERGHDSFGISYTATDLIGNYGEPGQQEFRVTAPLKELGDADLYECISLKPDEEGGSRTLTLKLSRADRSSREGVYAEARLLKKLNAQQLTVGEPLCFPQLVDAAAARNFCYMINLNKKPEFDDRVHMQIKERVPRPYLVCEWLPVTLTEVARWSPERKQPLGFVMRLAIGCARALDTLHRAGYAHRCVAPDNLALRLDRLKVPARLERAFVLCNLSTARLWRRRPRAVAPFVGTRRFASARAHRLRDQGPADDFVSLAFLLVQLLGRRLPWDQHIKNDEMVVQLKENYEKWPIWSKLPRQLRYQLESCTKLSAFELVDVGQLCTRFHEAVPSKKTDGDSIPAWIPTQPR